MDRNTFTTTESRQTGANEQTRVTYGMHYIEGNRLPYFSITCDIREHSRYVGGGAAHEHIAKHFPELRAFIPWHLCDQDGTPMHYRANAIYWYGMAACWVQRSPYDRDPRACFLSTIGWGHVSGDESEPRLTMKASELGEWLDERLPKLQEAFKDAMAKAGVRMIEM
jgi:hypothetical protein